MKIGLRKLFCNLAVATKKSEDRRIAREKLHGHLRKIRIISSRSPRQSVIHDEITRLEKNLTKVFDTKLHLKDSRAREQESTLNRINKKEAELNAKIERLNKLLFKAGKKVNIEKFKKSLGNEKSSLMDQLENKLYELEAKYHKIESNYPEKDLANLKEKISSLKQKIRELK